MLLRPSLPLALSLLLAATPGCGDDHGHEDEGGHGHGGDTSSSTAGGELDGVIYEGAATDEALIELLAATPVDDATQAAGFTAPAEGSALDPAAPPTFTWEAGAVPRHGDPVNGRAYLVVFATATDPEVLRVFTTETSYTPDAAAWSTVTGAGAAVTVTITSAIFEQNRVAQGGGPWVGPPLGLGG